MEAVTEEVELGITKRRPSIDSESYQMSSQPSVSGYKTEEVKVQSLKSTYFYAIIERKNLHHFKANLLVYAITIIFIRSYNQLFTIDFHKN